MAMKIGYVYKLVCKDINVKEIYIGSTVNINQRRRQHKNCCTKTTSPDYNVHVYTYIRENGGWGNWDSIVVEQIEFNQKHELQSRERFYLEELKATLNKRVPGRERAEYRANNRAKLSAGQRMKYTCQCGITLAKGNKSDHDKSKRHLLYITNLNAPP